MKLLSAEFLFDGEDLLENKAVVIHNDKVVDIDSPKNLSKTYQLKVDDLGKGVLFPGFVNLHTHLELSYMKNKLPQSAGFVEWLNAIMIKKVEKPDENVVNKAMENSIKEQFESGVRIIGDVSNTLISCPYLKKYMPKSTVFFENYGLTKERACKIRNSLKKNMYVYSKQCENLTFALTAHSIYSTHSCLISYLANIDKALPFSIHFLESAYEKEFLSSQGDLFNFFDSLGLIEEKLKYKNVFDYLKNIKAFRKKTIFVHCVYADRRDLEKIGNLRGTVCLCLRSNEYISNHLPDVYMIEKSGVNIGIGTDSLASNWNLNFIDELRFIYEKFSDLKPKTIFRWASKNGAEALNINLGFKKGSMAYDVFIPTFTNSPLEEILTK